MSLAENATYFSRARVIPVLHPGSVESGVAISRLLFDAGLRMQEIALRGEFGLETLAALGRQLPELVVGAGSVLTEELGNAAIQAGAGFLVSPGTTDALLNFAIDCDVPFLPGVATLSELMCVQAAGCSAAKLFPAQMLGGTEFLRAVAGPMPTMKFCPTGGIDAVLAPGYLRLANVLAVGGSWMAPDRLIVAKRFTEIRRLAEAAAAF